MARIKITDLPLLQDLTEEQLKVLFGAGFRRFRPSMEELEDRKLMSVSSLLSSSSLTLTNPQMLSINTSTLQLTNSIKIIGDYQPTTNLVDPLLLVIQPKDDTIDYYQSATPTTPVLTPANVPSTGNIGIQGIHKLNDSDFENGVSAIATKVNQLGAYLGQSFIPQGQENQAVGNTNVLETGNHLGLAQFFTDPNGSGFKLVTWSPKTGANLVEGLIFNEYGRVGGTNWGFATSDAYLMPGRHDAVAQFFWDPTTSTGKLIVWTQKFGAHATEGPIMEKALALGGGNGSGGYGVPISSIFDIPGSGKAQNFSWGPTDQGQVSTIATSPNTGTHDVAGAIRDRWLALGRGNFGMPTTDSTVHLASGNRLNAVVHFRKFTGGDFFSIGDPHDSAIGTTDKGTFFVTGEIYTAWYSNGGGLGFGIPTSDEHEADSVSFDASFLAWLGLRDQPQIYRLNTFRSSDGRQRTIYWSGDPGVGNPHFLFDYGNGQGPQNMDWTPKGGPNGSETKFIAEPLIPGSEAIGTTSAPLTVSPTYQSLPYAVGSDFGSLQIPQYTPATNSLLTDSIWSSPNLWSGTPATTFTEFADFQAPADVDFAAINGMRIDPPAPVNDPTVDGVTTGDTDGSQATPVPIVGNITFALTDDNGMAHQLQITVRTPQPDGSTTFEGVWDADSATGEAVAGTIVIDAAANARMTFSGDNESFDGIVSGDPGLCHLDGQLTALGADPIHVAGDQVVTQSTPVIDFGGVNFSLTDDSGAAHQLQILTLAAQPDGSNTFEGVWDGQSDTGAQVTGTLVADGAGNVNIAFSSDSLSFNGSVSGTAGLYHLDGQLTVLGADPVHVIGDQTQEVAADDLSLVDSAPAASTPAATTIAVQSSSAAASFGDAITFTATVATGDTSQAMPTGVVTFFDNGVAIGTASLDANGQASVTTAALGVGDHVITASYDGDDNFQGSAADSFTQTVAPAATQTTIVSSAGQSGLGQAVTFTATVSGVATPAGTVSFMEDSTVLGSGTLTDGVATFSTSALGLGSHSITAVFASADGNFAASTSAPLTQQVLKASRTTVSASLATSTFGQAITLTAHVAAAAKGVAVPTGKVTFMDGGVILGTAALVKGSATLKTSALTAGSHAITAVFSGDSAFGGSTSAALTEKVNAAATTTTLTSSSGTAVLGQTVTFSAAIRAVAPGTPAPTGTVTFKDGTTVLGSVALGNGVARLAIATLTPGSHSITAVFVSDTGNFAGSATPAFSQNIAKVTTKASFSGPATALAAGTSATLTATITALAPGAGTPTGDVTFKEGAVVLGKGTLVNGVATLQTSTLRKGRHVVTAVYGGDGSFLTSTSVTGVVTIT